ncbi:unnamed protein product [Rangifer tarandus platyrhynchus]|uniref:Uncharacterized protein n=2 Tax=Rangifer tarandus platyrhynchus TaxID=3082113 RepID=A0ABN8ZNN1_RANTA|nr:unnamed protein product [Rangifer tarandus platyrhynchus]CAI9708347.1 unnamed protein product [Rangifer tarandus platyrhynchus]
MLAGPCSALPAQPSPRSWRPAHRGHRGVGEVAAWGPRQAAGFPTLLTHQVLVKRLLHKGCAVDTEDPAGHKADPEICPTGPKGTGVTGRAAAGVPAQDGEPARFPYAASVTAQQRVGQARLPGTAFTGGNASAATRRHLFCVGTALVIRTEDKQAGKGGRLLGWGWHFRVNMRPGRPRAGEWRERAPTRSVRMLCSCPWGDDLGRKDACKGPGQACLVYKGGRHGWSGGNKVRERRGSGVSRVWEPVELTRVISTQVAPEIPSVSLWPGFTRRDVTTPGEAESVELLVASPELVLLSQGLASWQVQHSGLSEKSDPDGTSGLSRADGGCPARVPGVRDGQCPAPPQVSCQRRHRAALCADRWPGRPHGFAQTLAWHLCLQPLNPSIQPRLSLCALGMARPCGHLRALYVQDDGLEIAVNSWPVGLSQDRPPKQLFCRREQVSKAAESQGIASNLCRHHLTFCP